MKQLGLAVLFLAAGLCSSSAATVDLTVSDGDQNKVRLGAFENDNGFVTFRFNFAMGSGELIKDIHIRLLGGYKFGSRYGVVAPPKPVGDGSFGAVDSTSYRVVGNKFDAVVVSPRVSDLDPQGNLIFSDLFGSELVGATGKTIYFNFTPTTSGEIVPAPLPGAVGMLLSGLAGVALLRRRPGRQA